MLLPAASGSADLEGRQKHQGGPATSKLHAVEPRGAARAGRSCRQRSGLVRDPPPVARAEESVFVVAAACKLASELHMNLCRGAATNGVHGIQVRWLRSLPLFISIILISADPERRLRSHRRARQGSRLPGFLVSDRIWRAKRAACFGTHSVRGRETGAGGGA